MSLITSLEELKALGFQTGERKVGAQSSRTSGTGFGSVLKAGLGEISEDMDAIFEDAAKTYGISSRLLRAVAKAESNFNPNAVSKAGAVGVMQLMPGTAKSLGVSDSYDARQNIMGGAKYLKQNLDKFGDVRLALAAYNAGPNSVQKYGGVPPYKETQNYVKKIMGYLDGETLQANQKVTTRSRTNRYAVSSGSSQSVSGTDTVTAWSGLRAGDRTAALLSKASFQEDGDTVTMDKESFSSLVELVRIQMMMNAGKSVGDMSIL